MRTRFASFPWMGARRASSPCPEPPPAPWTTRPTSRPATSFSRARPASTWARVTCLRHSRPGHCDRRHCQPEPGHSGVDQVGDDCPAAGLHRARSAWPDDLIHRLPAPPQGWRRAGRGGDRPHRSPPRPQVGEGQGGGRNRSLATARSFWKRLSRRQKPNRHQQIDETALVRRADEARRLGAVSFHQHIRPPCCLQRLQQVVAIEPDCH